MICDATQNIGGHTVGWNPRVDNRPARDLRRSALSNDCTASHQRAPSNGLRETVHPIHRRVTAKRILVTSLLICCGSPNRSLSVLNHSFRCALHKPLREAVFRARSQFRWHSAHSRALPLTKPRRNSRPSLLDYHGGPQSLGSLGPRSAPLHANAWGLGSPTTPKW
jgi:hypothetical protein